MFLKCNKEKITALEIIATIPNDKHTHEKTIEMIKRRYKRLCLSPPLFLFSFTKHKNTKEIFKSLCRSSE